MRTSLASPPPLAQPASLVFSVPFSIEWKQGFISSRVKWLELNWVVRTCIYMYILFMFHSRRVVFQVGETSTNPIFLSVTVECNLIMICFSAPFDGMVPRVWALNLDSWTIPSERLFKDAYFDFSLKRGVCIWFEERILHSSTLVPAGILIY